MITSQIFGETSFFKTFSQNTIPVKSQEKVVTVDIIAF